MIWINGKHMKRLTQSLYWNVSVLVSKSRLRPAFTLAWDRHQKAKYLAMALLHVGVYETSRICEKRRDN